MKFWGALVVPAIGSATALFFIEPANLRMIHLRRLRQRRFGRCRLSRRPNSVRRQKQDHGDVMCGILNLVSAIRSNQGIFQR